MSDLPLPLILASGSPRRAELLSNMGLSFSVLVTDTDESRLENEKPLDFVRRLSQDKARAALAVVKKDKGKQEKAKHESPAILAADTIVTLGDKVFGKPKDFADAQNMWRALANQQHHVITAVCLATHDKLEVVHCLTKVHFDSISETQMLAYWNSGDPVDKAGAYAIQGLASAWVQLIDGSYSNVVGLPLYEVNQLLKTIHKNWL